MEIFGEIEPLRTYLFEKRRARISIGLVPTMGALHQGHLSLIKASKAENDLTVATIYINPTQFNNAKDLDNYPRTQEADIALLESEKCDILFKPENSVMYGASQNLKFDFGHLDKTLEGKFRPGHFSGVALVVSKLFNIVRPDRAYFGQKDYQQLMVISKLNDDLKFLVEINSIPIAREPSGLAMSSRNQRLTNEQKEKALLLFDSLKKVRAGIQSGVSFQVLRKEVEARFHKDKAVRLEYLELVHKHTLESFNDKVVPEDAIILIAAFVGEVRLIDNMLIEE